MRGRSRTSEIKSEVVDTGCKNMRCKRMKNFYVVEEHIRIAFVCTLKDVLDYDIGNMTDLSVVTEELKYRTRRSTRLVLSYCRLTRGVRF